VGGGGSKRKIPCFWGGITSDSWSNNLYAGWHKRGQWQGIFSFTDLPNFWIRFMVFTLKNCVFWLWLLCPVQFVSFLQFSLNDVWFFQTIEFLYNVVQLHVVSPFRRGNNIVLTCS